MFNIFPAKTNPNTTIDPAGNPVAIIVVIVGLSSAMSNAALEEGSEEMQEVDIAEIKKLKVCPFEISE